MYGQGAGSGNSANDNRLHNGAQQLHPDDDVWNMQSLGAQMFNSNNSLGQCSKQPITDTFRDPQLMTGFIRFPPNQSKRDKLQSVANQELENWERFKDSRKPEPINLTPKKLGGMITEEEARSDQQITHSQSKYRKLLKREENKKKQRDEEEAKIQKMKDLQRQKAEKLEQKKKQKEMLRQIQFSEDKYIRNNAFLDRLSHTANNSQTYYGNPSTVSLQREDYNKKQRDEQEAEIQKMKDIQRQRADKLEAKKKQEEMLRKIQFSEDKYMRNNAFLDHLSHTANYSQTQADYEPSRVSDKLLYSNMFKEEEEIKLQEERRRVNNAFLDRLQRQTTSPKK